MSEAKSNTKILNCKKCESEVEVKKRSDSNVLCSKCRKINSQKPHTICGNVLSKCKNPNICRKPQLISTLIKYFEFDKSSLGSEKAFDEFNKVRNKLYNLYWNEKYSLIDLAKKFNYKHPGHLDNVLNSLNISKRNISDSISLSISQGKFDLPNNYQYKHGWHTTWNNKQVFYRSSYELDYAQYLDEQQIDYEMESIKIQYWDSQNYKYRTAIPDFYLPEYNLIVEVKSNYTFDETNMNDKIEAYKNNEYNFILYYDLDEFKCK